LTANWTVVYYKLLFSQTHKDIIVTVFGMENTFRTFVYFREYVSYLLHFSINPAVLTVSRTLV